VEAGTLPWAYDPSSRPSPRLTTSVTAGSRTPSRPLRRPPRRRGRVALHGPRVTTTTARTWQTAPATSGLGADQPTATWCQVRSAIMAAKSDGSTTGTPSWAAFSAFAVVVSEVTRAVVVLLTELLAFPPRASIRSAIVVLV
jgi:hypothetical protein